MSLERHVAPWIDSVERSDLGYTYVRLYTDAPERVRHQISNLFGKGTVFLPPQKSKPLAA